MNIEVYCLANNEERLMPYFMRHYNQFAHVILLESNSTDTTVEIANNMGAEIWKYDVPDEINELFFTELKNTCWKKSSADWVMIVDADEFIYHPDVKKVLRYSQATVIMPRFINMYSEKFPTTERQIYDEVKRGVEQFSPKPKMNVFRPRAIKTIDYFPGCHEAFPQGNVKINSNTGLLTLHMRNLSKEFVIERNMRARHRNSQMNKEMGWGVHVEWPQEEWERIFDEGMRNAIKIL